MYRLGFKARAEGFRVRVSGLGWLGSCFAVEFLDAFRRVRVHACVLLHIPLGPGPWPQALGRCRGGGRAAAQGLGPRLGPQGNV